MPDKAVHGASSGTQQLSAMFELAKILVSESEPERMLSGLLPCLIETLEAADAGSVWLWDTASERLKVMGAVGYDLAHLRQLRLAPGESIAGEVFRSGQAQVYATPASVGTAMANLSDENQDLFQRATVGVHLPLSAVCVPLSIGEAPIGAMALLNLRQRGGFDKSDLDFLRRVADLIALAIENARLREELEVTTALSEANRLKAEVISILAHEMRTPLTSIKGYSTALLMEEADFCPETQREFLQFIDEECDVLQDLIHDLLESSVIDAGLLRLEFQPVRLPPMVQGLADDIARRSPRHRFLVDFAKPFPILDADPERIAQVLRNLLDNAVKYSPDGGLVVVSGEVQSTEVVVSVADQGPGIAPEHLNRLFEKFFRAGTGLGRHVVGSGLGLPIAHSIVESHGGRIWAESRLEQGTTLFFTLALAGLSQQSGGPEEALHD